MSNRRYPTYLTAKVIRQTFIEYFGKEDHSYVRSSPVKPFCDPTLEFVNAGMNQFKNVFLGLEAIRFQRVTNSQKCIRVGGKHNDLNAVGHDSYHHTFFEMLGNWSFNDYFKDHACRLAWDLVTSKPYSLDPKRLYVTYFGGDEKLNLPPDLETKDIWQSIGVSSDRILPFGMKDNFWEMGLNGPCGPCSEIHYDHLGIKSRSTFVNKDSPDLTELWNIVFVQYNRLEDGNLKNLEKHFVDTGMGFERLVALLQGKSSNYDSDLFAPLFSCISKVAGCREYSGKFGIADMDGLDTSYRMLADHSRMISVAIADNIFPNESHGLRRVITKALIISEKLLPGSGLKLILELSKIAGESFSGIFPEVVNNQRQIEFVLRDEEELWNDVKLKVKADWEKIKKINPEIESLSDVQSTGLISSFKELTNVKLKSGSCLPSELSLILYDRYGLSLQVIEELSRIFSYSVNITQLERDILKLKDKNKSLLLLHSMSEIHLPAKTLELMVKTFPPTDDSFKVNYYKDSNDCYKIKKLSCKVQAIILNGNHLQENEELRPGSDIAILLDKTSFWSSIKSGGDSGILELFHSTLGTVGQISVEKAINIGDFIYHFGKFSSNASLNGRFLKGLEANISINKEKRLQIMQNMTAAHLLSIAIKERFVANLQSFDVSSKAFSVHFSIYGQIVTNKDIKYLEERLASLVDDKLDTEIVRRSIHDLIAISDFSLPSFVTSTMKSVHLINIKLNNGVRKREITIGPIVLNTSDVGKACFTNVETTRKGNLTITGMAGGDASEALEKTNQLFENFDEEDNIEEQLLKLKSFLKSPAVPLHFKIKLDQKVQEIKAKSKSKNDYYQVEKLKEVILRAEKNCDKYIVLYIGEDAKLEKLTRLCQKIPVMLFALNRKNISARCCVPPGCNFTAEEWMSIVAEKMGGRGTSLKGHAANLVFILKPMKIEKLKLLDTIQTFEDTAKTHAEMLLSKYTVL